MNALDLLKKQHKEVKSLFGKLEKTEDGRSRRQLLEQVATQLEIHTKIEEEIFYPAVKELPTRQAQEMVAEAYEEHHVVDLVLADLRGVDPADERFAAKITVLSELVLHHAEEEEKEMFKMAKRLGTPRLKALGQELQARADELGARGRKAA